MNWRIPTRVIPRDKVRPNSVDWTESIVTDEEKHEFIEEGSNEIYVGNLNYEASEEELSTLFQGFGKVISVRIAKDYYTGMSRGFAHVKMEKASDARTAKTTLSGKSFRGRIIYLDWWKSRQR